MRLVRLYARYSGQSRTSAVANFDGGLSNNLVTVGRDNNRGDNEQLGNYLDDHFCNYNKRINNGWFHNEWDDDQHLDQRINRHDRDRLDI